MILKDAQDISDLARQAFGIKSSNKIYDYSANDYMKDHPKKINRLIRVQDRELRKPPNPFELTPQADDLKKAIKRNTNNLIADSLIGDEPDGLSPYKQGEGFYARYQAGEMLAGNCRDQSFVAAYLAIKGDATARRSTWVVSLKDPGDHLFCLVGLVNKPNWSSLNNMAATLTDQNVFIIDPWMNFACHAMQYTVEAADKCRKWLREGKRVYWDGPNGKKGGYYPPDATYQHTFLNVGLSWRRAIQH